MKKFNPIDDINQKLVSIHLKNLRKAVRQKTFKDKFITDNTKVSINDLFKKGKKL